MNKVIYSAIFLFCAACSGTEKKGENTRSTTPVEIVSTKKYACPMQCEGEKTYVDAGKCPVCKMDLQEIAMTETDSSGHAH